MTLRNCCFNRSDSLSSKEDSANFLSSLESPWSGFVDMPAVARFLTKVYPVSGILDHLTQVNWQSDILKHPKCVINTYELIH